MVVIRVMVPSSAATSDAPPKIATLVRETVKSDQCARSRSSSVAETSPSSPPPPSAAAARRQPTRSVAFSTTQSHGSVALHAASEYGETRSYVSACSSAARSAEGGRAASVPSRRAPPRAHAVTRTSSASDGTPPPPPETPAADGVKSSSSSRSAVTRGAYLPRRPTTAHRSLVAGGWHQRPTHNGASSLRGRMDDSAGR